MLFQLDIDIVLGLVVGLFECDQLVVDYYQDEWDVDKDDQKDDLGFY